MKKKQKNRSEKRKGNHLIKGLVGNEFGNNNWIIHTFWFILLLVILFSGCDSGWSIAGWEVK